MGIHVDYVFHFEGTEAELRERMERVRQQALDLPVAAVGEIVRLEPVINTIAVITMEMTGIKPPPLVAERMKLWEEVQAAPRARDKRPADPAPTERRSTGRRRKAATRRKQSPSADEEGMSDSPYSRHVYMGTYALIHPHIPADLKLQWAQPGRDLIRSTDLWNAETLPSQARFGHDLTLGQVARTYGDDERDQAAADEKGFAGVTFGRKGLEFAFAEALLQVGYTLTIDPGRGCGYVHVCLSALCRGDGPQCWLGYGFCKTQYAEDPQRAHTNVIALLDALGEVGLLHWAEDDAGYHKHRNWNQARKRIAAELSAAATFANRIEPVLSGPEARQAGVQVVGNNAASAAERIRALRMTEDEAAEALTEEVVAARRAHAEAEQHE